MGAMLALLLTGMMVVGIYRFFRSSEHRQRYLKDISYDPMGAFLAGAMMICLMACFWGVLIPPMGQIPLSALGMRLQVSSAEGIGFLVFLGLLSNWLGRKDRAGR